MRETPAELSQLQQEVAELWSRFRKDEPLPGDEEGRRALAEQARSLEAKRRVLAERRSAARHELELHRRRASRLSPAVRAFGWLIGVALVVTGLIALLPVAALVPVELTPGQGATVLTASLLLLALSVAPAER